MHLVNGLAAPCMGGGAWVDARCWLGGRGRGLFVVVSLLNNSMKCFLHAIVQKHV